MAGPIFPKRKVEVMQYEYKAVPFTGVVEEYSASQVAEQLSALIRSESLEGWEFYQINSVNINVSPGCLASLFGAQASTRKHDMVILRRYINVKVSLEEVEAGQEAQTKHIEEDAEIFKRNEPDVRRLEQNGYRFVRFDATKRNWIFVASNLMEFTLTEKELKELCESLK